MNVSQSIHKLNKLEKLKIDSFKDDMRTDPAGSLNVTFNPTSYALHYGDNYTKSKTKRQYTGNNNLRRLSITLIIDGTGVINRSILNQTNKINVNNEVTYFMSLAYGMHGDTHETRFLTIRWGQLNFECRLEKVNVKYTLFDRDGIPLRAELDAVFFEDINNKKRLLLEDKQSADLTHSKQVMSDENLPLIAYQAYGNSTYYIQLAQANQLNNFRAIKPGTTLSLPPIKNK